MAYNMGSNMDPPPPKQKCEEPAGAASAAAHPEDYNATQGLQMELDQQEEIAFMQAEQEASFERQLEQRVEAGNEGLHFAEAILKHRFQKGNHEYLVH